MTATTEKIIFERHIVELDGSTNVASLLRELADGQIIEVRVDPVDTSLRGGWVTFRPTPSDGADQ